MFISVSFFTNKLKPMKRFYANILGLDIVESSEEQFTVHVGETDVTFKQSEDPAFYHFAINIPGNQFTLMKQWISNRVSLLRSRGRTEIYYEILGGDSMYFKDPAGNTVELIGRRNRDLFGSLTNEAFLDVSEVGITTPYLYEVGEELQDIGLQLRLGTEVHVGGMNYLGDDGSYIVLVPPKWKWEFSEKEAETHPLEIVFTTGEHIAINEEGLLMHIEKEKADD